MFTKRLLTGLLTGASLLLFATACSNGDGDPAVELDKQKDALRTELRQRIDSIDKEIENLKSDVKKTANEAGQAVDDAAGNAADNVTEGMATAEDKLKRQIDRLDAERTALERKLDELGSVTARNWREFRNDVESILSGDES